MKRLIAILLLGVWGFGNPTEQKDIFKSLLTEALREKYSMQIYCIPPDILFYAPLNQEQARDSSKKGFYGKTFAKLHTYEQYKDKLQDFIANHNLSIIKESKNKRGHNTCVVDFMREGEIVHTFSFEGYYATQEDGANKLFIDDKAYLWKQYKAIGDFQTMFCPYPEFLKNGIGTNGDQTNNLYQNS